MDDSVYIALGKLIEKFNYLEGWVSFFIGHMLGFGPKDAHIKTDIIVKEITYQQKINILTTLVVNLLIPEKSKKFTRIYSQLCKCGKMRNELLHSQWFINYGNTSAGIPISSHRVNRKNAIKKDKKVDYDNAFINIKVDEIFTVIALIEATSRELFGYFDRINKYYEEKI